MSIKSELAAVLQQAGIPVTQTNIDVLGAMAVVEGVGQQGNNPLDTTQPMPGSTALAGNSAGVQQYGTLPMGVSATAKTLTNGNYTTLVNLMKSGASASQIAASPGAVADVSKWEGGGGASTWKQVMGEPSRIASYISGGSPNSGTSGGSSQTPASTPSNPMASIPILGGLTDPFYAVGGAIGGAVSGTVSTADAVGSFFAMLPMYMLGTFLIIIGAILLLRQPIEHGAETAVKVGAIGG